ncbi:MAG: hypothetical protein IPO07_14280 [Haliscomenobacter sp.]|nr:hypothetical protein [Haliscomenobacter sp.]MBK9489801.1 hypothetical protein [Haliscomenobacter sp.]
MLFSTICRSDKTAKKNCRSVYENDLNRIISGMSIVGQWQKRMEAIIQYLIKPKIGTQTTD